MGNHIIPKSIAKNAITIPIVAAITPPAIPGPI
jgi:hypothetical protein